MIIKYNPHPCLPPQGKEIIEFFPLEGNKKGGKNLIVKTN